MIREDSIDVLVDLSQHTSGNRLLVFASQPAPVQVSFAGYPESAGIEAIPYRITDPWLEDCRLLDSESRDERVFLIDSFWCYDSCGRRLWSTHCRQNRMGTLHLAASITSAKSMNRI
jgi:hypothetical protein